MTDLEMTRLCAEAMGYEFGKVIGEYSQDQIRFIGKVGINNEITWERKYDPIRDDAQAMALVKKFLLVIKNTTNGWYCESADDGIGDGNYSGDLNRAIVECVAKMQASK